MPRYIRLNEDNIVTQVRLGKKILEGELQSDEGNLKQKLVDGLFIDLPQEEILQQADITQQTLIETKYQTILLEMLMEF